MKKYLAAVGLATALFALIHTHYEVLETTRLSRDTYLHTSTRITENGLTRLNVLEIPLNDPYLSVGVFNSQVEYGLRQSTTRLLYDGGAFAGVNGDFFGLSGRHSVSLGLEIVDGHISAHTGLNAGTNNSASFLLGAYGAFIDYVHPQINLVLNGYAPFYVGMVNMVSDLRFPSFLTHGYVQSTACIDERLGRSYKIVVYDGYIVSITHYTVDVPQNGFVVIMNTNDFHYNYYHFYIGQRAEMAISANVYLDQIHTAVSGSNSILYHGEPTDATIRYLARHPRTLLGLNATGCRLILMTIDGRGDSIGANFAEAAAFMLEFGAHYAINLDGGGSTTMAARLPLADLAVINTPSEGSQRAVINTIGVVNNSTVGSIVHLEIVQSRRYAPVGLPTPLYIRAFDEFMNSIYLPQQFLQLFVYNGYLTYGSIIPLRAGTVYVQAVFGDIVANAQFRAIDIAQIVPSAGTIFGQTWLSFTGMDNYGRSVPLSVDSLQFQVFPPEIGHMYSGLFIPHLEENGWLTVAAHNTRLFVPIEMHPYLPAYANLPESDTARDSSRRQYLDVPNYGEFDLLFLGAARGLQSYYRANVLTIHIDASHGGIARTNPAGWGYLAAVLERTTARDIIIQTNYRPMYFTNRTEFGLFHNLMRGLADSGRNVFVVSVGGEASWVHLWDGVRYVNLAYYYRQYYGYYYGYYYLLEMTALRLRIGVDSLYYAIEEV
ncbi:MAG: phosphodiester glycosidase family protein [Defluviitaleaceae bacterium]|nr:phosphodiester glycosidase family protein [Defluviitaleaceae bacterium]